MRLFLDTNVIMDQLDPRRVGHAASMLLEEKIDLYGAETLCSWHTLSILEYVCRKPFGKKETWDVLQIIVNRYSIPETGSQEAKLAFSYLINDYEDAMQIAAAIKGRADYIITNDKTGFAKSPIPVVTTAETLKRLS